MLDNYARLKQVSFGRIASETMRVYLFGGI
jgi:hypothetical protein